LKSIIERKPSSLPNYAFWLAICPIDQINDYFEKIWYEKLMSYKTNDILSIEIWLNSMMQIWNICKFETKYDLRINSPIWFQEFICSLFKKEFKYEKKEKEYITPGRIKSYFEKIWYDTLINYTGDDIDWIDIWVHKIASISNICNFKTKNGISKTHTPIWFQEFICFLFDKKFEYEKKEKEYVTPERIKNHFFEIWYEKLMTYNGTQIDNITIGWYTIHRIKTLYNFDSKYELDVRRPKWFQEFISNIFWKKFEYEKKIKKEITIDQIKNYFVEIWYEKLMIYNSMDIKQIDILGNTIWDIKKQYWFKTHYDLQIWTLDWFKEFVSFLFNKKFSYVKKDQKNLLKDF
jgi:hypothetical protein